MKNYKVFMLILIFINSSASYGQNDICGKLEKLIDKTTASKSYTSTSLDNIYKTLLQSPGCDDTSYAEGVTEIVAKSLSANFASVMKWGEKDKFKSKFILDKINATADWKDLKKIMNHKCKTKNMSFCEEIRKKAKSSLAER